MCVCRNRKKPRQLSHPPPRTSTITDAELPGHVPHKVGAIYVVLQLNSSLDKSSSKRRRRLYTPSHHYSTIIEHNLAMQLKSPTHFVIRFKSPPPPLLLEHLICNFRASPAPPTFVRSSLIILYAATPPARTDGVCTWQRLHSKKVLALDLEDGVICALHIQPACHAVRLLYPPTIPLPSCVGVSEQRFRGGWPDPRRRRRRRFLENQQIHGGAALVARKEN